MYQISRPEESIYNLLPKEVVPEERPPIHRSRYPASTPPTASTFGRSTTNAIPVTNIAGEYSLHKPNHPHKKPFGEFGPKEEHYADTTNFMKKHSGHKPLPAPKAFHFDDAGSHGGRVDAKTHPSFPKRGPTRNFIAENAIAAITTECRKVQNQHIDYLQKPDFGMVPGYLQAVQKEIQVEKDYIQQIQEMRKEEEARSQPKVTLMDDQERVQLLMSLKTKWQLVNGQYQLLTHLTNLDTMGKMRRKEEFESQLGQLEKAIEKLSKKHVYINESV